jgi:hypothetical protein
MSRVPHPDYAGPVSYSEPLPADYSDEVTEEQEASLKALVADENLEEWEVVSGPAW